MIPTLGWSGLTIGAQQSFWRSYGDASESLISLNILFFASVLSKPLLSLTGLLASMNQRPHEFFPISNTSRPVDVAIAYKERERSTSACPFDGIFNLVIG